MAAEVVGLDVARPLDTRSRAAVHQAFLAHQLLVFRDQCPTSAPMEHSESDF